MRKKFLLKRVSFCLLASLFFASAAAFTSCKGGEEPFSQAPGAESEVGGSPETNVVLEWSKPLYTLTVGGSEALSFIATENGENLPLEKLKITSANERLVRIEDGKICGIAYGKTTVSIRFGEFSATAEVLVLDPPQEEIRLDKEQYGLILGDEVSGACLVSAELYRDGRLVSDAEMIYSVADPDVAAVDKSGRLVAVNAGRTTLKVSCNGFSATGSVVICAPATAEQINSFDERYVNRFGRLYSTAEGLNADNVASGLELAFYGTEISAEISVNAAIRFRVCVDGEKEGAFVKASAEQTEYLLAEGLPEGVHTIRILKSSEIYDGKMIFRGFGGAERFLTVPEKPEFSVEFIGDSITCGYGALGTGARTVDNSDACSSFACLTARALNADFSCIALQGICVSASRWTSVKMTDMYRYTSLLTGEAFDFSDSPDVVVVGLGTNDASYITDIDASYASSFAGDYAAFLRYIRSKRQNAYIVCVYGMMGLNAAVNGGILQAIESLGDEKISYLSAFKANSDGANGHPSAAAHAEYAEILSAYIEGLLQGGRNAD